MRSLAPSFLPPPVALLLRPGWWMLLVALALQCPRHSVYSGPLIRADRNTNTPPPPPPPRPEHSHAVFRLKMRWILRQFFSGEGNLQLKCSRVLSTHTRLLALPLVRNSIPSPRRVVHIILIKRTRLFSHLILQYQRGALQMCLSTNY